MFLGTASKIAWRDLKAAPAKFLFVTLAVAVGVAALSGVKGFGYAFKGMLLRNAKQLIAADVQAQIWNAPSPDQNQRLSSTPPATALAPAAPISQRDGHHAAPPGASTRASSPTIEQDSRFPGRT